MPIIEAISANHEFDLLDIGGDSNSIGWMKDFFGVSSPLGLNIEKSRLLNIAASGHTAINMNCFELDDSVKFDFVCMSHFLEHLTSRIGVFEMIQKSTNIANKVVYISGPLFESDDLIRQYGFKFVWGDWIDHASRYSLSMFSDFFLDHSDLDATFSLGFGANPSDDNVVDLYERPNINSYERDRSRLKNKLEKTLDLPQEYLIVIDMAKTPTSAALACNAHLRRHGVNGQNVLEFPHYFRSRYIL